MFNGIDVYVREGGTCIGVAATNVPTTTPPKTRPSEPASETLSPLALLLLLPLPSVSINEPDKEIISNRP